MSTATEPTSLDDATQTNCLALHCRGALGSATFFYSWRLWDLRRNVELKRLKDCDSPFEPLE